MKLYEISERYRNLAEILEEETINEEAIVTALRAVKEEFGDKARNIARFIQNLKAEKEAVKAEKDRLAKKEKAISNKQKGLTTYLLSEMLVSKIDKISDPVLPLALRKAPPSVEVESEAKVPEQYLIPQEPVIDKRGLLEALKAGEQIPGVRLVNDRKYLKIG